MKFISFACQMVNLELVNSINFQDASERDDDLYAIEIHTGGNVIEELFSTDEQSIEAFRKRWCWIGSKVLGSFDNYEKWDAEV